MLYKNSILKMVNLYLDDVRTCPENYILATSYDEFVDFIKNKEFPNLFLLTMIWD
ncbi:cyclic-phosphate processing receiver domain-containing protein [Chryseobacterium oryzae]|uniref:cyclic-phosphate processing receiver domain-containing protein n=1 Tax=Chryseobacterium oryzae TaxID=2929799 RepID=UPI00374D666B